MQDTLSCGKNNNGTRDVPSRVPVLGRVPVLNHYYFDLFFCSAIDTESKLGLLQT